MDACCPLFVVLPKKGQISICFACPFSLAIREPTLPVLWSVLDKLTTRDSRHLSGGSKKRVASVVISHDAKKVMAGCDDGGIR